MSRIRSFTLGVFASMLLCGAAFGQVGLEAGSQGSAINGDSSAVGRRSPGQRLQGLLSGPQITETSESIQQYQSNGDNLVAIGLVGLVGILFELFNQTLPVLPAALASLNGGVGGTIRSNNIVIMTELADDGNNAVVEILNPGAIRVPMDGYAFCTASECSNRLTNIVLEPDDVLAVQLDGNFDPSIANTITSLRVGTETGELALYNFGSSPSDPTDGTSMVDYIQWGGLVGTFGLQDIAAQRGLWSRAQNSSIDVSLAGNSFQLDPSQERIGGRRADDYIVVPFADNSLGQTTAPGLAPGTATAPVDDMSGMSQDVGDTLDRGGRGGRGR